MAKETGVMGCVDITPSTTMTINRLKISAESLNS